MKYGFILTRYVNSNKTNKYWNHCVKLLRTYYPNISIIIIDDNSNKNYLSSEYDYKNITVINSEYHGRGELLSYIYFLRNKWFENAIIIHDSVFFHKTLDFDTIINQFNNTVIPLWHFTNNASEINTILRVADSLNHKELIKQHIINWNKYEWNSCFGVMCLINHTYLIKINNKYNLHNLIDIVKTRSERCALERIFGIIFYIETNRKQSLFGNMGY